MGRESPFVSLEEERRRADALRSDERAPIPFFILTGFLGAGKTTLLNRLLSAPQGRRIAVLVNDVGAINVDRQLISAQAGDVIELSGGCVCCKVDLQRDLFSGVDDLVERARPDVVVLETTGIADPRALLAAFDEVEGRRRLVTPAGVACVVDAEVGLEGEARPEWRAQIEAADRLVVSKRERVAGAILSTLQARLGELAPGVEIAAFPPGDEATQALARFLLAEKVVHRAVAAAHHHSQLAVHAFAMDGVFLEAPLRALLESLGDALVRAKGHVRVDRGRWLYVERAGKRIALTERDVVRETNELVLIVEADSISEEALRRRLWACRTTG